MRFALTAAWLLPLALGNAISSKGSSPVQERSSHLADGLVASSGSSKQDIMASGAAINQQLYQAAQQTEQFKKCNLTNLQVRQEW
jgi:tyrosinase